MDTLLTAIEFEETGRKLGYDLFAHGRFQRDSAWPECVQEGYALARSKLAVTPTPSRFERKWLQLRLSALSRGRTFDDRINPEFLKRIDLSECPIIRTSLTHGELIYTDWSVDRINNNGGYALHNIAVISTRANSAKGERSFLEIHALSAKTSDTDGLTPTEWLRLAAIMHGPCFVDSPSVAPIIPMVVSIPLFTVCAPTQIFQQLFVLMSRTSKDRNNLKKHFRRACKTESQFGHFDYLVDLLHVNAKNLKYPCDVWLNDKIFKVYLDWVTSLGRKEIAEATRIAQRFAQISQHNIGEIDTWSLNDLGYIRRR